MAFPVLNGGGTELLPVFPVELLEPPTIAFMEKGMEGNGPLAPRPVAAPPPPPPLEGNLPEDWRFLIDSMASLSF